MDRNALLYRLSVTPIISFFVPAKVRRYFSHAGRYPHLVEPWRPRKNQEYVRLTVSADPADFLPPTPEGDEDDIIWKFCREVRSHVLTQGRVERAGYIRFRFFDETWEPWAPGLTDAPVTICGYDLFSYESPNKLLICRPWMIQRTIDFHVHLWRLADLDGPDRRHLLHVKPPKALRWVQAEFPMMPVTIG